MKEPVLKAGALLARVPSARPRPPLKTMTEMAKDFGVSMPTISRWMSMPQAPRPIVISGKGKAYFRPAEVRAFRESLNQT